jgi:hypothetical protein
VAWRNEVHFGNVDSADDHDTRQHDIHHTGPKVSHLKNDFLPNQGGELI